MNASPRLAILAIAGVVAVAPASAWDGSLDVEGLLVPSGATEGVSRFFWLESTADHDNVGLAFSFEAAKVTGQLIEKRAVQPASTPGAGPVSGIEQPLPPEVDRQDVSWEQVAAASTAVAGDFLITVRPIDREAPMALATDTGSFQVAPFQGGGFYVADGVSEGGTGGPQDGISFSQVHLPAGHVLLETTAHGLDAEIRGDLLVEFQFVDLSGEAAAGAIEVNTIERYSTVAPDVPDESMLVAKQRIDVFARLQLEDAVLRLQAPDFEGLSQWLDGTVELAPQGDVVLLGATGVIEAGGQRVALQDERYILEGSQPLRLEAAEGDRITVVPTEAATTSAGTSAAAVVTAPLWILVVGAAVAFVAAVLWLRRASTLQSVEAAIERGRYRRAAMLAGRLVAREPKREDAAVARAVALSKAGRHERVIDEVEKRLKTHGATDGVLHYLLGVSFWKAGSTRDALASFREAVRRTPELRGAIAEYAPPRYQESGGYA